MVDEVSLPEESAQDLILNKLDEILSELQTLNIQLAKLSFSGSNNVLSVHETTPT